MKLRLGFENGALTARWKNAGDSSSIGQKDGQWPGLPMSSETWEGILSKSIPANTSEKHIIQVRYPQTMCWIRYIRDSNSPQEQGRIRSYSSVGIPDQWTRIFFFETSSDQILFGRLLLRRNLRCTTGGRLEMSPMSWVSILVKIYVSRTIFCVSLSFSCYFIRYFLRLQVGVVMK